MKCPSCNVEMEPLVAGIFQCPQCRKILKPKDKNSEQISEETDKKGEFLDGEYFHTQLTLNKEYEICEKGIIISKTEARVLAALICHSTLLKSERYVRISWWKAYQHAGMIKIYDNNVLNNLIKALEKIDEFFDELWNWKGSYGKTNSGTNEDVDKNKKLDIIKYRILENKTCPNCQQKMEKHKSHYICQHCSEIVILEGYNQPIFNIDPKDLDLQFHSNFPINFYMPISGITIKWLVGEWKAIVVIYSSNNPNKRWLRFYWWTRDFSKLIKYGQREMAEGTQMGWKAQKGVSSPNIYDKKDIRPLINALKKISNDLNWT
jgi:ribosomal protein L37AE/L43A